MLHKTVLIEASISTADESMEVVCGVTLPESSLYQWGESSWNDVLGWPVWTPMWVVTRSNSVCSRVDLWCPPGHIKVSPAQILNVTEIIRNFFFTCLWCAACSPFWVLSCAHCLCYRWSQMFLSTCEPAQAAHRCRSWGLNDGTPGAALPSTCDPVSVDPKGWLIRVTLYKTSASAAFLWNARRSS